MTHLKETVLKIEALTQEPGFVYTLAFILMRDMFLDPNEVADINWYEHLSFQELTFLVGLLVKHEINFDIPTAEKSHEQFKQVYNLFKELHNKHTERIVDKFSKPTTSEMSVEEAEEDYRKVFGAGDSVTESIFYSGSGAYDFQYLDFSIKKYQKDAEWLLSNKNIKISAVVEIARDIKKFNEHKFITRPDVDKDDFPALCQCAISVFCFTPIDFKHHRENVESFLDVFSLIPGKVNPNLETPGQYNELQSHPIIRFPDGRYFIPVGFNLSESIYESPFYWINTDQKYREKGLRHRGEFAEEIAVELLKRTFGEKNVYTKVEIKKNKEITITDIDVLAIAGNKAVIVQVKSKRLTELSKTGNEKSLINDFQGAIQEAYEQGLQSRSAVVDKSSKLFVDGKELILSEKIDDAYILCMTLDHYPSVTHQIDVYLKKSVADPYPIAISTFDLDILTFYLKDPFEFLYYIRQRIKFHDRFKADCETTFLAVHLKYKLYPKSEADMEAFDNGFAQLIDANFPALYGSVPKTKATQKLYPEWKNEEFQKLIDQVKSSGNSGFTDAIFFLYDLAGKGADDLIGVIKKVKKASIDDSQLHDARLLYDKGKNGITVMVSDSIGELQKKLISHSIMCKYKSRSDTWLALGSLSMSENLVDVIGFNKEPWKRDDKLEKIVKEHFKTTRRPTASKGIKVGRNERCPCGSGKKFKKCHGV